MRALTDRESRTVRIAAIALAVYLVLFFGLRGCQGLERKRSEYRDLISEARNLKQELQPYENRTLLIEKLRTTFHLDPLKLSRTTLVAEASAAIQKTAQSGGVKLGPIRESAARPAARELTSMQLEGSGQVAAVMALLHRLETLGYPLLLDSLQLSPQPQPGMIKFNLTIVILDFEQWKPEEKRDV